MSDAKCADYGCQDRKHLHICGQRCSCGKPFYAWHNPTCKRHPLPADGSPCECCGQVAQDAARIVRGGTPSVS